MASRPRLLLILLPLLLVAWSGCPCVYSRWIADAKGEVLTSAECVCPCCAPDVLDRSDDEAPSPPPPCERRNARNPDLPPAAPELIGADTSVVLAVLPVDSWSPRPVARPALDREVIPAPPDDLRRGTVLLN